MPKTTESAADSLQSACPKECHCFIDYIAEVDIDNSVVDCKSKKLQSLPDFSGLEDHLLYRIYLDNNDLSSLPDSSFLGLQLEGLQLSNNPGIRRLTAATFRGVNDHLNYLSLRRTSLSSRPAAFLQNMTALQVLDLAEIQTDVFQMLVKDTFGSAYTLEELNLANNHIAHVYEMAFAGFPTLMILNLDDNALGTVPIAVKQLPILEELSLARIGMRFIEETTLRGLQNLKTLNLEENLLSNGTIHSLAFWMSPGQSLENLNLRFNSFEAVPSHLFQHLRNLRKLDLSGNKIKAIRDRAFYNLERLEELDLSNNPITTLSDEALVGLEGLQVIHLKGLQLTEVPTLMIAPLFSLRELDLTSNQIVIISNDSFATLNLEQVSLTYNNIQTVSSSAFQYFYTPAQLIVNDNKIEDVSFLTESHCVFSRVEMNGNDVDCDCDFYGFLARHPNDFELYGECSSPAELKGTPLSRLMNSSAAMNLCSHVNTTWEQDQHERCPWELQTSGAEQIRVFVVSSMLYFAAMLYAMVVALLENVRH